MYEVDYLKNNEWVEFWVDEDIKVIDKVVYKLTNIRPDKQIRILKNNNVLCWLDGTMHQYMWWKNTYVRDNNLTKKLELRNKQ